MQKWHFMDHLGEEWRKIYLLILLASATDLLGDLMKVHLVSGLCSDREIRRKHQIREAVGETPSV